MQPFKNMMIYRLAAGWAMTAGSLEAELAKHPLMPCTGLSLQTRGWVPPHGEALLVAGVERDLLIGFGTETKVLPSSALKAEIKKQAGELEATQGFKPGNKQLRDIKERAVAALLPRAFSKRAMTRAWISPAKRLLVVDCSSPNRAEELLEQLRNTLGELPVTRLETFLSPQGAMTQWLTLGQGTRDFALDSECELKGTGEERATVRYLRHDLSVKEIREHIAGGKVATRCGLVWRERSSFTLAEPFAIRKLRSLETEKEDGQDAQTLEQQFEANFLLNTGVMGAICDDLIEALGGEKE